VLEPQAPAPVEAPAAPVEDKEAPVKEEGAEPEADDGQPRDEKGKFKSPTQARMDELTRARREAEREAAYWRARANPEKVEAPAPKPTIDQFEDHSEYVEALTDWKAKAAVADALKARDSETAQSAEQRAQQTKAQSFAERQEHAKASISDYDAVVGAADVPVAQHVADAIVDSEKGPELLYHLAKHPELAERLSGMSVREADREIGRIEASLGSSNPAPVTKPASNAPAPMRPTGRNAATSVTSDPAKMGHDEFRVWAKQNGSRWVK
jgi:hypothetical protein